MATALINQITERVFKGAQDGIDVLAFPALSIIQVGLSASEADYAFGVDYRLTGGSVDWSLPGKEPAVGAAYYVTYTFQADSSFKDFTTVRTEMKVNMGALQPNASTADGAVTTNLFIDLPATSITNLYGSIQRVSLIQSLNNLTSFQGTELADYGANFSLTPGGPTFSTGFATFAAPSVTTIPIVVPSGATISTLSTTSQTALFFSTTETGTIYPGQISVTIPIQAQNSGSTGNVGAGTIVILGTPIIGISSVTNQNPTIGGTDSQSDESFATEIKESFLANDSTTFPGIRRLAKNIANVEDALVVGAGDPLLTRGGGAGGKVDLYIQAVAGIDRTTTDTPTYNGVALVLSMQPVLSITSVVDTTTSTTLSPSAYQLIKDVSDVADSTSSTDSLLILSGVTVGDVLAITYTYNGVLQDCQNFFDTQDANGVPARDFLSRSATEVFIDVTDTITLLPGSDPNAVIAQIQNNIANYIGGLLLGATIKYSTIYDLIDSVTGVDDTAPLSLLAVRGQTTAATIVLARNQFPLPGNINIFIKS